MYTRDQAHSDIAVRAAELPERRRYDWIARAVDLLYSLVITGYTAGLPEDVTTWPAGHPADWVIATMQAAPDKLPNG